MKLKIALIITALAVSTFMVGCGQEAVKPETHDKKPYTQAKERDVNINILAKDKRNTKDSTPVILHIKSIEKTKKNLDFYHAITLDKKYCIVWLIS